MDAMASSASGCLAASMMLLTSSSSAAALHKARVAVSGSKTRPERGSVGAVSTGCTTHMHAGGRLCKKWLCLPVWGQVRPPQGTLVAVDLLQGPPHVVLFGKKRPGSPHHPFQALWCGEHTILHGQQ